MTAKPVLSKEALNTLISKAFNLNLAKTWSTVFPPDGWDPYLKEFEGKKLTREHQLLCDEWLNDDITRFTSFVGWPNRCNFVKEKQSWKNIRLNLSGLTSDDEDKINATAIWHLTKNISISIVTTLFNSIKSVFQLIPASSAVITGVGALYFYEKSKMTPSSPIRKSSLLTLTTIFTGLRVVFDMSYVAGTFLTSWSILANSIMKKIDTHIIKPIKEVLHTSGYKVDMNKFPESAYEPIPVRTPSETSKMVTHAYTNSQKLVTGTRTALRFLINHYLFQPVHDFLFPVKQPEPEPEPVIDFSRFANSRYEEMPLYPKTPQYEEIPIRKPSKIEEIYNRIITTFMQKEIIPANYHENQFILFSDHENERKHPELESDPENEPIAKFNIK